MTPRSSQIGPGAGDSGAQRKSARAVRDESQAMAGRIGGWLLIALALPRIVRMLYPEVWVEDDFYLESAWLVSAGMRPYLDFVHPHMPLLEWIAAGYLKLFGTSHLSLEALNEAAIFATSVLVYSLARRIDGALSATLASILYAYSSLVFRYHMYERESFVAPLLLLAAIVALDESLAPLRQAAAIAMLLFVACAIKLTAVIALAPILLVVAAAYRRVAAAVASGAIFLVALGAFSTIVYLLYGNEFIFQTFIFHFLKGHDSGHIAVYPCLLLGLLGPLFVLGCIRILSERIFTRAMVLVLAIVLVEYVFYGLLSPTAWGHNYLEVLPFIAIIAGVGAMQVVAAFHAVISGENPGRGQWMRLAGDTILIAIFVFWVTPIVNENWLHGSVYGFGFVPRAEIARLAEALRGASQPGDEVIAPAFICFEAQRRELIRYPETYGVYREGKLEYQRDGFAAARSRMGTRDFFRLIAETAHFWTEPMRDAIARGKVTAVINDSPIQLLPLVMIPDDLLLSNGFRPVLTTEHFRLWRRTQSPAPVSGGESGP